MVALIYLFGIALVLRARYLGRSSPSGAGGAHTQPDTI